MIKKEPIESIASSFRCVIWILAIPSVVFTVFLGVLAFMAIHTFVHRDKSETTRVVVANTNLPAGAVLATNKLAAKRFPDSDLKTDDWVGPGDADVLPGHRILRPVNRGEVIEWHNTDIVIANQGSPQQPAGADGKPPAQP